MYYAGWLYGGAIFFVLRYILLVFLENSMDLEMMSGADELMFHEDKRQCANIIAF